MRARSQLGQNFLIDSSVVEKILKFANLNKNECVLEIGPGTGALTRELANLASRVVAIEFDRALASELESNFQKDGISNVKIIHGDVLSFSNAELASMCGGSFIVVANIPYNITSKVLEKFLSGSPRPLRMVLMVQKEVADRMLAKPSEMGLLSVAVQLRTNASRITNVSPESFSPKPKVWSSVVLLELMPESETVEEAVRLAGLGFASRRKQLWKNLPYPKAQVQNALESTGLVKTARAQELSPNQWLKLAQKLV